jgi:hypothetical protein
MKLVPAAAVWMMVLVLVGCGKEGKDNEGEGSPGATGSGDVTAEAAETDETKSPADTPSASAEPTTAFDVNAFCAAVFAPDVVAKIVGVEGLTPAAPRAGMRTPQGMTECKLEVTNEHGIPEASAALMADCRGSGLDVTKHHEVGKSMGGGKGGEYRELAMGKGGYYARTIVLKKPIHTAVFVHDSLPCALTVSTAFIDANNVEPLAQHVSDSITDANRPR